MKNVSLNLSFSAIKHSFFALLHRFHVVIFVIIVMGGLAASVFVLNTIIIQSGDTSAADSSDASATFDKATIKRINDLKTPDQTGANLDLSKGRTNPFVE